MNKVSGDPPLGAWVTRLLGQPPQALLARPPSPPHTPLQPRGVSRASAPLPSAAPWREEPPSQVTQPREGLRPPPGPAPLAHAAFCKAPA